MSLKVLLFIMVLKVGYYSCCFPNRINTLTNSYIPAAVQMLYHYQSQLNKLYPYTFTPYCKYENGLLRNLNRQNSIADLKAERISGALRSDVCVAETLNWIYFFLVNLKREAGRQNLEDFQGFTTSVLLELKKTSGMTSAQQFYFILQELLKENIIDRNTRCKIVEFMEDLRNANSKLYRHFLNVKPLNYLV